MAKDGPRFAASFDDRAWAEDVEATYRAGSNAVAVAEAARGEFERRGVPSAVLQGCQDQGPGGERLGGCVKAYLPLVERPARERPFGIVFAFVMRARVPTLEFVAFGVRHQPPQSHAPDVYAIAHHRLHGDWP